MSQMKGQLRIVTAGPFPVAVFRAEGARPEEKAFAGLSAWAGPRGLLDDPSGYLLFGRNDPPPARAGDGYGYRYMLTLGGGTSAGPEVAVEILPRATWAVVRATLGSLSEQWDALYERVAADGLRAIGHGLEEHLSLPDAASVESLALDLWLPVKDAIAVGREPRDDGPGLQHGGRG